jgi:lipoprotein-anchoring transpeptidase ErfK/SrfK
MLLTRRAVLLGAAVSLVTKPAWAEIDNEDQWFAGTINDNNVAYKATNMAMVPQIYRRQLVTYQHNQRAGTIVIDTNDNFLYLALENNQAIRYGVGVGREGFQWFGEARIDRKAIWPGWTPPPEMLKRQPDLPHFMPGGADNPLGARALYLYRDGRDLGYRIHGTTEPWTIGSDVSSGCIRLLDEDVIDLYGRVPIGTKVLVLEHVS